MRYVGDGGRIRQNVDIDVKNLRENRQVDQAFQIVDTYQGCVLGLGGQTAQATNSQHAENKA